MKIERESVMSAKYRIDDPYNSTVTGNGQQTTEESSALAYDNAMYQSGSELKQYHKVEDNEVQITLNDGSDTIISPKNGPNNGPNNNGNNHAIKDGNSKDNPWKEEYFDSVEEETKWLTWMESQLKKIAGNKSEITLQQFKNAIGLKQCFFAERFFALCDSNNSGTTDILNLTTPLMKVTKGTPSQRLKFLFDLYDVDGNGKLDIEELLTVLRCCMEESSVKLSEDDLENLTAVLFESADTKNIGYISFDEFKNELEKHPGVIENLTISAAQWLKPQDNSKKKTKSTPSCCSKLCSKNYFANNLRKVLFYVWYAVVNIVLMGYAGYLYSEENGFLITARVCGLPLNFNCMLILILMMRKSLTYLRLTFWNNFLPLDHNILFHKRVGIIIFILAIIHTGAHIGNAVVVADESEFTVADILVTDAAELGTIIGSAYFTGWALDIILIIMIICSMEFVRRSGHFEVFYWTHICYIPFWILLIFHGPNFWKWFIAPGFIFIGEKISRSKFVKQARYGKTFIEEVSLLSSSVTYLEISRPDNFAYQPGDYVFIQIPVISRHEWHPFTVSSAPELDGRIWLHIRSAGNWTKSLYKYFDQYDPGENYDEETVASLAPTNPIDRRMRATLKHNSLERGSVAMRRRTLSSRRNKSRSLRPQNDPKEEAREKRVALRNKIVKIQCYIDGPYGTATREIFTTEHAVLIGAGIGVTPMASILQSVMYKFKASKRHCPSCSHEWLGEFTTEAMKLKKVDFIWINRDQKAFEWFISLLTALEVEQSIGHGRDNPDEKIIDMHMYMTAAVKKTEMKGIGLQIALDLMHEKSQRDLITGLQVKTQPGRPDWNKVFKEISSKQKGKVKVFFCGAPQLGKTIKVACEKFSFDFAKENF
ncbi:NADPH oxidase 5-like isoform X2 [Mytilus trossulus]|uniref:NADPH oxidase 5-like isoform X2 n=1 Tax=Mytilus trossulus TaxID=6551 RepID=UPI0030054989